MLHENLKAKYRVTSKIHLLKIFKQSASLVIFYICVVLVYLYIYLGLSFREGHGPQCLLLLLL